MERIDGIVGNVHADDDLAALYAGHESAGTLERVVIDADDRRRSRFRATTDAGTDVGVVVDKAAVSAGDVLLVEDDRADRRRVRTPRRAGRLAARRDGRATRGGGRTRPPDRQPALGSRDRRRGRVRPTLEADRHIVERVVADVVPGSEIHETTVEADLFVTELEDADPGRARGVDHDSEHGHEHGSGHGHGHEHGHSHEYGPEHDHDHTHDNPHESHHDH